METELKNERDKPINFKKLKIKWDILVCFILIVLCFLFMKNKDSSEKFIEEEFFDSLSRFLLGWAGIIVLSVIEYIINFLFLAIRDRKSITRWIVFLSMPFYFAYLLIVEFTKTTY